MRQLKAIDDNKLSEKEIETILQEHLNNEQLKSIKNEARLLRSIKGQVPLSLLLSVGLFETDKVELKNDKSKSQTIKF